VSLEQSKENRVGLLGVGYIADFHLNAVRKMPGAKVEAVCDLNFGRAKQFADSNGVPQAFGSLDQMLKEGNLDTIHVLTPPHIHYQNGQDILAAGQNVFFEKPLCHTSHNCQSIIDQAMAVGAKVGVSHNFLFSPAYEKLMIDLDGGKIGKIDQIDIVWNKQLGQLSGGPYGVWMLQNPKNILFEVAPHAFVYVVHLLGSLPDSLTVSVNDRIDLPRGLEFYRRWEIIGWKGSTSIRIRLSFIDGYPEHYVHVRGTNGAAWVDQEHDFYHLFSHTPQMLDIDRYINVINLAKGAFTQANSTLSNFIFSKLKVGGEGGPFSRSILRSVRSYYTASNGSLDRRIDPTVAKLSIELAEWVAQETLIPDRETSIAVSLPQSTSVAEKNGKVALVLGGTGFIGQALVNQLGETGYQVKVLARDPRKCPDSFSALGVEVVKGDFTDEASLREALEGVDYVYHLARGSGDTWTEYLKTDVEPTERFADLCLEYNVKRFIYTSSIAIYDAGSPAKVITEATKPSKGMSRVAPYTRSKVENERRLLQKYRDKGLPIVIFRPGVVLGTGSNPYHWGISGWPYSSVSQLWGDGNNPLPIVLVDDVASALVKAIQVDGIEGESFNLASPPCLTANDYLDEFEAAADLKVKRVQTSTLPAYLLALAKWTIKVAGKDPNAAFPSIADIRGRSLASRFDCSKAEKALHWEPVRDRELLVKAGIYEPVAAFFK
jgi:nucleoside-diphosphate-sugar epimerase/predicted dehydrogenase